MGGPVNRACSIGVARDFAKHPFERGKISGFAKEPQAAIRPVKDVVRQSPDNISRATRHAREFIPFPRQRE
jgi:hypothetical protein